MSRLGVDRKREWEWRGERDGQSQKASLRTCRSCREKISRNPSSYRESAKSEGFHCNGRLESSIIAFAAPAFQMVERVGLLYCEIV